MYTGNFRQPVSNHSGDAGHRLEVKKTRKWILAGWINHREQEVIEYLRAENRVLREKLGKKRILLNDDQRRLLAVKGKILGRKMLEQMATIVTPDTILRWHWELVAAKWNYSGGRKKIGRPPASAEVIELVLRMALMPTVRWFSPPILKLPTVSCIRELGNELLAHGRRAAPLNPEEIHVAAEWTGILFAILPKREFLPVFDLPMQGTVDVRELISIVF